MCIRLNTDHRLQISLAGTRKSRAVHKCRKTDAFAEGARLVLLRKTPLLLVVARVIQRSLQQCAEVNVFADHLAGGRGLALLQKVTVPELCGRQAHGRGYAVHVTLQGKDTLRRAEAAKSAMRRSVGGHRRRAHADVVAGIRAGGMDRPARQHHGA